MYPVHHCRLLSWICQQQRLLASQVAAHCDCHCRLPQCTADDNSPTSKHTTFTATVHTSVGCSRHPANANVQKMLQAQVDLALRYPRLLQASSYQLRQRIMLRQPDDVSGSTTASHTRLQRPTCSSNPYQHQIGQRRREESDRSDPHGSYGARAYRINRNGKQRRSAQI